MTSATLTKVRKAHRSLVGLAAVFLTLAGITGILWAYAPFIYWDEGYMQRKKTETAPALAAVRISPAELIERLHARFGDAVTAQEITLKTSAGLLVYRVRARQAGAGASVHAGLMDAVSGEWLSPLNRDRAIRLAGQYVRGDPAVETAVLLEDWTPRKQEVARPAWRIRYQDPGQTEIFLDLDTGEILEDQDARRRFHFWVMDLHQLNFFGFHKTLTLLPGALLIGMVATGWVLWYRPRRKRSAGNVARHAEPQASE